MPAHDRARIEAFWQRWLDANAAAERDDDWTTIADFYAEDATYGWMYHPDEHFMAVGREQIRDLALGVEMEGMDGWTYEYVATVIDDTTGMIVGFWKQHSNVSDAEGREYEILGIGGSWFGYQENAAGEGEFAWQRDWFDMNSTAHTFLDMLKAGDASEPLVQRMHVDGPSQPGHYRLADMPAPVWPPAIGKGRDHVGLTSAGGDA